jgi:hypothetical protein
MQILTLATSALQTQTLDKDIVINFSMYKCSGSVDLIIASVRLRFDDDNSFKTSA